MSTDLLKRLEGNLALAQAEAQAQTQVVVPPTPAEKSEKEVQDDYDFSRKTYRELVDKSNKAIEAILELALNAEHPRAFEVLSLMLKNTADITGELMNLQAKKKDVAATPAAGPTGGTTIGSQNIFVGSTAELQKHLIRQTLEKNVTDSAIVVAAP